MSEIRPLWNYGKNASFGLRFSMLSGNRVLVLVHKGVIFSKARAVVYKMTVPAPTSSETAPTQEPIPVTVEMKIRIKPKLTVVPSCGAILSTSDFPICLFASEGDVVYTGDSLETFKKFSELSDGKFYEIDSANGPEAFEFPELDKEVYVTEEGSDETKRGLLVPLWRIALREDGAGCSIVDEVLDIRNSDTLTFEEKDEDGTGNGEQPGDDEECDPHGDPGDDGSNADDDGTGGADGGEGGGGGGGGGGGAGAEEGVNDPGSEEETKKPC